MAVDKKNTYRYEVAFSFDAENDEMANDFAHSLERHLKSGLLPHCKISERLLEIEGEALIRKTVWER